MSETESNTTTTTTPPDWAKDVPEKFRRDTPEATIAELAKGYTNAEKALSSRPKESVTNGLQITKETSQAEVLNDDDGVEVVFARAGVKIDDAVTAFETNGGLDADAYAKLKSKGLTKKMADQVVATASREKKAIYEAAVAVAGGEEQLDTIKKWAGTLPPDDIAYYNERLSNPSKAKNAMKELVNAYNEANGGNSGDIVSGSAPSSGAGYADDAAYQKDLATLRRQVTQGKVDEALRAKVAKEAAKRRSV